MQHNQVNKAIPACTWGDPAADRKGESVTYNEGGLYQLG